MLQDNETQIIRPRHLFPPAAKVAVRPSGSVFQTSFPRLSGGSNVTNGLLGEYFNNTQFQGPPAHTQYLTPFFSLRACLSIHGVR